MSSINRVLRNLASKSFDSASSASSSSNGQMNQNMSSGGSLSGLSGLVGSGNNQDPGNVYDKLRLLNGGQPWSNHASAW